jgi:hypothetical protein
MRGERHRPGHSSLNGALLALFVWAVRRPTVAVASQTRSEASVGGSGTWDSRQVFHK